MNNFQARPINPFRIGTGFTGEPPAPTPEVLTFNATTTTAYPYSVRRIADGSAGFWRQYNDEAPFYTAADLNDQYFVVPTGYGGAEYTVKVWTGTAADSSVVGKLAYVQLYNPYGTTIADTSQLSGLAYIGITNNPAIEVLDLSNCTLLTSLSIDAVHSLMGTIDLSGNAGLTNIEIIDCYLVENIDFTGCTGLNEVIMYGLNSIVSIDLSDSLVDDWWLFVINNNASLTDVIIPDGLLCQDHTSSYYNQLDLSYNDLSTASLEAIYDAIGDAISYSYSAEIIAVGNSGTAASDPTPANNKGWAVIGA